MDIKIEKGIPIPKIDYNRPKNAFMQTLESMEVGDSFFVPESEKAKMKLANMVSPRARALKKKYTIRSVAENGIQGNRVWRTK